MVRAFVASLVSILLLDFVWLGWLMRGFYRDQLAPFARMQGGALAPIWPVAILVYLLLAAGVAVFVVPKATDVPLWWTLARGALFGVVVYGVYDLTNYSTLAGWPLAMTVVDLGWGAVVGALASGAATLVTR
jgi:uncharacterized membrane protein